MIRPPFASRTFGLALGISLLLIPGQSFAGGWHIKLPFRVPNINTNGSNGQNGDGGRYNSPPPMGPDGPLPNTYYNTHTAIVSDADKTASDKFVDQGNQLINQRQYQGAIRPLLYAIQANPNNAIAYNDLGAAYMDLKQNAVAASYFSQAITHDASLTMAYRNLGLLHDQTDASQAIPDYTKVLQLTPTDSQVWAWRGYDYSVCGNPNQAMYDYTRAIHLNPKYADAYHWRGKLELQSNHAQTGYADLRRSRTLDPSLGPAIAKDIHMIVAAQNARRRLVAQMPQVRRVVRQGPHYYYAVYQEARRDGDSEAAARQREEDAEFEYRRDCALQDAWDHDDQDAIDNIEGGNWSRDQIINYVAQDPDPNIVPDNDNGGGGNVGDDGGGGGDDGGGGDNGAGGDGGGDMGGGDSGGGDMGGGGGGDDGG